MCSVYSINLSVLAHTPLWISRGELKQTLLEYTQRRFFVWRSQLPHLFHTFSTPTSALTSKPQCPSYAKHSATFSRLRSHKPMIPSRPAPHLELKEGVAGTGLTLPSSFLQSPVSASPTHSKLQFEPWLSPGPSAMLSLRLLASSSDKLPFTVAASLSAHLEQLWDN